MKRQKTEQREPDEVDLFLFDRSVRKSQEAFETGQQLLHNSLDALIAGDPVFADRLLSEAQNRFASLPDVPIHPALADSFAIRTALSGALSTSLTMLSDCTVINAFKKDLDARLKALGKFITFKESGGSFEKPKFRTRANGKNIVWNFVSEDPKKCKCACLVSVFHFRDGRNKAVRPTVRGFKRSYVDDNRNGVNTLPHGGRDFNGYAVDTPFFDPLTKKPVKCPCYLGQYKVDEKGERKDSGTIIEGHDAPSVTRRGLIEHFETAAICFDKQPYVVLNSMRWRDGANGIEVDLTDDKKIDHGDVSEAFKLALFDWIERAKRQHKIKDIKCCE